MAAGVPEARRDPGPGARVRGVVVLQRHLNAHPPPLPDRRRQVQDHAHAHLDLPRRRRIIPLRRGRLLQARRQDAAPGQSEAAEAEGGEDEATRRARPPHLLTYLPTYLPTTPSAPAGKPVPGTTAAALRVRLSAGVQRRNGVLARFSTRGAGGENEGEADRPRRVTWSAT